MMKRKGSKRVNLTVDCSYHDPCPIQLPEGGQSGWFSMRDQVGETKLDSNLARARQAGAKS